MQKDALDYSTLNVTLEELYAKKNLRLADEIQRILRENTVEKPSLHNKLYEPSTGYYKVDLNADDINEIRDMFLELEVSFVGEDGNTTPTASFYASLADKWFNVVENLF